MKRVVAVDWSGDAHHARSRMWLAEAEVPGELVRLEAGRDRSAITQHLLGVSTDTVIGLDFGFSFPTWFLELLNVRSAVELWTRVADEGEAWLTACQPPFWGRRGSRNGAAQRRRAVCRQ